MNQILYVEKKSKRKNRGTTNLEIKKIVYFFSIAIIVLGVVFVGQASYGMYKSKVEEEKLSRTVPVATVEKDGTNVKITVSHDRAIEKIIYSWNNEETIVISGNERIKFEEYIALPAGNNILNLKIIDVIGNESEYNKEFISEVGKDITKPKIELSVVGNYVKIIATDETELAYVTYRWNDEVETTINPNETENAKIEQSVEILKGQNKLTVSAVDKSSNAITKTETFEGRVKPEIEVYIEGDSLVIKAKHEDGIEKIQYNFNNKDYDVKGQGTKELEYKQKLDVGYNKIIVKAYSSDGAEATFEGECNY